MLIGIIEPDKEVIVGTKYNCPDGHQLVYNETSQEKYRCDLCQEERRRGRYSCNDCHFDVCTKCRPAPEKAQETVETVETISNLPSQSDLMLRCYRDHKLELMIPPKLENHLFICGSCCSISRFSGPRWVCESCYFYLCEKCRNPEQSFAMVSSVIIDNTNKNITCLKKHELKYAYTIYPSNCYACDRCERKGECTSGRWHCPICNYDICILCKNMPEDVKKKMAKIKGDSIIVEKSTRPRGTKEDKKHEDETHDLPQSMVQTSSIMCSSVVSGSLITECDNDHHLWFSKFEYASGRYKCNKCLNIYECYKGRWFCAPCKYDICPNCRPKPELMEEANHTCYHGHLMSESVGGTYKHYRCTLCRKMKKAEYAHWWCPICNYYVCSKCIKIEPDSIKLPEQLEESKLWCKTKKHEFIKSREVVESFICQKRVHSKINSKYFSCLYCGMIQCNKCALESSLIINEIKSNDPRIPGQIANEFEIVEPLKGEVVELT